MNRDEQGLIQNLFGKLAEAERTAPPREIEADRFIQDSVARQPGAPYYMAQTIIVQEQALEAAQARIQELEAQGSRSQGSGGLFGSLFGGGSSQPSRPAERNAFDRQAPSAGSPAGGAWGNRGAQAGAAQQTPRGGGFLAGAAQTAVGVAGGMMLGSMLGGMFAGDGASEVAEAGDAGGTEMADAGTDEGGFDDFGGGFDDL